MPAPRVCADLIGSAQEINLKVRRFPAANLRTGYLDRPAGGPSPEPNADAPAN